MTHIEYNNKLEELRRTYNYPNFDTQDLIDYCLHHFDILLQVSEDDTYSTLSKIISRTIESYGFHTFFDALHYAFEDELNLI